MAQADVKVSVERVIHDELRKFAQNVSDKYGIQINQLTITWMDVSEMNEPRKIVAMVNVDSTTRNA